MYGLVNQALRELVEARLGPAAWGRVCRRAGSDVTEFLWNEAYPDTFTQGLVVAASEELGLDVPDLLEAFGIHWVLHTAPAHYGSLLTAAGDSLPAFLRYLPQFHDRIVLLFPELRPPEFDLLEEGPDWQRIRYRSHREGLQPFVVGLVRGLGQRFGVEVEVTLESRGTAPGTCDIFLIRWGAAP